MSARPTSFCKTIAVLSIKLSADLHVMQRNKAREFIIIDIHVIFNSQREGKYLIVEDIGKAPLFV